MPTAGTAMEGGRGAVLTSVSSQSSYQCPGAYTNESIKILFCATKEATLYVKLRRISVASMVIR